MSLKSTLLSLVFAAAYNFLCAAETEQATSAEPYTYITKQPVVVYGFNLITGVAAPKSVHIAGSELQFIQIGGDLREDASLGDIVVIQFLKITSEPPELTADSTKINAVGTDNGEIYCIRARDFKPPMVVKRYKTFLKNAKPNVGILVIPMKIRPKIGEMPFDFVTDFNLGTSVGWSLRVSHYQPNYISIVGVFGVTSVGVDSSSTKGYIREPDTKLSAITPGIGIVGEFGGFQVGFVFGGDFVGGRAGEQWFYNERIWYSLGLGYQFLRKNDSK